MADLDFGPRARGRAARQRTVADALMLDAVAELRDIARRHHRPALRFGGSDRAIALLHLAERSFAGEAFPFVILHLDRGHNFPEIVRFRDRRVAELDATLIVHPVAPDLDDEEALAQGLAAHGLDVCADAASDGAPDSVDERAIVHPLARWTDLDVWRYLADEEVPVSSVHLAHRRAVVRRGDALVPVTASTPLALGERLEEMSVRLSDADDVRRARAIASAAESPEAVLEEAAGTRPGPSLSSLS